MERVSGKKSAKLFYRIREVSQIAGVKPHVLRYWESEFPQLAPQKGPNDQRRYRQKDIDLVLEIKKLLYEDKFTIAGARRQLAQNGRKPAVAKRRPAARRAARNLKPIMRRLSDLRREVAELQTLLAS